jgi:intracellular sulfur oxidation DsrE/DsrF family protein
MMFRQHSDDSVNRRPGIDCRASSKEEYSMIRTAVLSLLFASISVFATALPATAADSPAAKRPVQTKAAKKHKVIFQVSDNDPGKWNLALNNARNVQQDLGEGNVEIEIVAYGPGLGMLKMDSTVGNRVSEAMSTGVKVMACENTMTNQKLSRDDMLSHIGYVKAGVVELMEKQEQGWSYIRP